MDEGPEADWKFEVKPLNAAEVHYPKKGISYLESSVPKRYISQQIKQGSKGVYECLYEHAPRCRYSVENHVTLAIHIQCAHIRYLHGMSSLFQEILVRLYMEYHFKTHHPEITGDDHYRSPLDLAGVTF